MLGLRMINVLWPLSPNFGWSYFFGSWPDGNASNHADLSEELLTRKQGADAALHKPVEGVARTAPDGNAFLQR